MLVRWLQQVLFGTPAPPAATETAPRGGSPTPREGGKLLDVVREALREEALELGDLVAQGVPAVRRRRMRRSTRQKVRRVIDPAFAAPEVVEEVTERLVTAAEADPYYARLLADDETK